MLIESSILGDVTSGTLLEQQLDLLEQQLGALLEGFLLDWNES
jgi:hypothetical protein